MTEQGSDNGERDETEHRREVAQTPYRFRDDFVRVGDLVDRTLPIVIRVLPMAPLVLAVAGTLGFLAFMLTFGGVARPLALAGQHPRREGIELVLFPLGVVA